MINYDFLPRSISPRKKHLFKEIFEERLRLKQIGDSESAQIYKIIINSVYGCMNYEKSHLFDPENLRNVCFAGQLMMADLVENLAPHIEPINTNTDGIIFVPKNTDAIESVYKNWEKRTRMTLELSFADKIIQKDVNNYCLLKNGKIVKGIGSFVSKAFSKTIRQSLNVVDEAVINFLAFEIDPKTTIEKCKNMLKFQIITKSGKSYDKVTWVKNNIETEVNRVNRIYASNNQNFGEIFKYKTVKNGNVSKQHFGNTPKNCLVDNENLAEIKDINKN
jgi:hypothetical protein